MKLVKFSIILLFIYSCDEVNSAGPTSEDITNSEIFVALANEELEEEFSSLYNSGSVENCFDSDEGSIECYQLIDFSGAHAYYQDALDLNPDNIDAHFGVGITEFLNITQDQSLYDALNEWNEYFSEGDYDGYNNGLVPNIDIFSNLRLESILNLIPVNNKTLLLKMEETERVELSDIQNLLETSFLDRLNTSIQHFDIVLENDFTFNISGEMQGSSSFHDLEMDNFELYMLKAQMHYLAATINLIIAYDFDGPMSISDSLPNDCYYDFDGNYYSSNGDFEFLNQNSSFLSIRKQGALPSVISNLNAFISSLDSALEYIQNETDFQTDDIISFEEVEENYIQINEELNLMHSYLNEDYTFYDAPSWIEWEIDDCEQGYWWDGYENGEGCPSIPEYCSEYGYYCPEITVNIANFFNTPVTNLKTLMPEYSIVEQNCTCYDWDNNTITYPCWDRLWSATSWDEWKEQISDPTIGGLFPNFTTDDMINYFGIECIEVSYDIDGDALQWECPAEEAP